MNPTYLSKDIVNSKKLFYKIKLLTETNIIWELRFHLEFKD